MNPYSTSSLPEIPQPLNFTNSERESISEKKLTHKNISDKLQSIRQHITALQECCNATNSVLFEKSKAKFTQPLTTNDPNQLTDIKRYVGEQAEHLTSIKTALVALRISLIHTPQENTKYTIRQEIESLEYKTYLLESELSELHRALGPSNFIELLNTCSKIIFKSIDLIRNTSLKAEARAESVETLAKELETLKSTVDPTSPKSIKLFEDTVLFVQSALDHSKELTKKETSRGNIFRVFRSSKSLAKCETAENKITKAKELVNSIHQHYFQKTNKVPSDITQNIISSTQAPRSSYILKHTDSKSQTQKISKRSAIKEKARFTPSKMFSSIFHPRITKTTKNIENVAQQLLDIQNALKNIDSEQQKDISTIINSFEKEILQLETLLTKYEQELTPKDASSTKAEALAFAHHWQSKLSDLKHQIELFKRLDHDDYKTLLTIENDIISGLNAIENNPTNSLIGPSIHTLQLKFKDAQKKLSSPQITDPNDLLTSTINSRLDVLGKSLHNSTLNHAKLNPIEQVIYNTLLTGGTLSLNTYSDETLSNIVGKIMAHQLYVESKVNLNTLLVFHTIEHMNNFDMQLQKPELKKLYDDFKETIGNTKYDIFLKEALEITDTLATISHSTETLNEQLKNLFEAYPKLESLQKSSADDMFKKQFRDAFNVALDSLVQRTSQSQDYKIRSKVLLAQAIFNSYTKAASKDLISLFKTLQDNAQDQLKEIIKELQTPPYMNSYNSWIKANQKALSSEITAMSALQILGVDIKNTILSPSQELILEKTSSTHHDKEMQDKEVIKDSFKEFEAFTQKHINEKLYAAEISYKNILPQPFTQEELKLLGKFAENSNSLLSKEPQKEQNVLSLESIKNIMVSKVEVKGINITVLRSLISKIIHHGIVGSFQPSTFLANYDTLIGFYLENRNKIDKMPHDEVFNTLLQLYTTKTNYSLRKSYLHLAQEATILIQDFTKNLSSKNNLPTVYDYQKIKDIEQLLAVLDTATPLNQALHNQISTQLQILQKNIPSLPARKYKNTFEKLKKETFQKSDLPILQEGLSNAMSQVLYPKDQQEKSEALNTLKAIFISSSNSSKGVTKISCGSAVKEILTNIKQKSETFFYDFLIFYSQEILTDKANLSLATLDISFQNKLQELDITTDPKSISSLYSACIDLKKSANGQLKNAIYSPINEYIEIGMIKNFPSDNELAQKFAQKLAETNAGKEVIEKIRLLIDTHANELQNLEEKFHTIKELQQQNLHSAKIDQLKISVGTEINKLLTKLGLQDTQDNPLKMAFLQRVIGITPLLETKPGKTIDSSKLVDDMRDAYTRMAQLNAVTQFNFIDKLVALAPDEDAISNNIGRLYSLPNFLKKNIKQAALRAYYKSLFKIAGPINTVSSVGKYKEFKDVLKERLGMSLDPTRIALDNAFYIMQLQKSKDDAKTRLNTSLNLITELYTPLTEKYQEFEALIQLLELLPADNPYRERLISEARLIQKSLQSFQALLAQSFAKNEISINDSKIANSDIKEMNVWELEKYISNTPVLSSREEQSIKDRLTTLSQSCTDKEVIKVTDMQSIEKIEWLCQKFNLLDQQKYENLKSAKTAKIWENKNNNFVEMVAKTLSSAEFHDLITHLGTLVYGLSIIVTTAVLNNNNDIINTDNIKDKLENVINTLRIKPVVRDNYYTILKDQLNVTNKFFTSQTTLPLTELTKLIDNDMLRKDLVKTTLNLNEMLTTVNGAL